MIEPRILAGEDFGFEAGVSPLKFAGTIEVFFQDKEYTALLVDGLPFKTTIYIPTCIWNSWSKPKRQHELNRVQNSWWTHVSDFNQLIWLMHREWKRDWEREQEKRPDASGS